MIAAPSAGGFGLTVWWIGRRVPPGKGFGSLAAASDAILGAADFPISLLAFVALAAILWLTPCSILAARWRLPAAQLRHATAPVLWGATLPALSLLLDPISFRPTAPVLAAVGVACGALLAFRRLAALDIDLQASPGSTQRLIVAGLSVALPMILLAGGWSAPSGDEPHYLTVAHSITTDRDLDLSDDYRERVYAPFHPHVLSPHYRPGLREGSRYSMHGVGLPLLVAPAYAIGLLLQPAFPGALVLLPRALLVLLYGLFAWMLYGFLEETTTASAARDGTAATTLLAPLVFAPLFIFSEVPAMLLSLFAFRGLQRTDVDAPRHGAALAALPFVGVKYIPLAGAIFLTGVWAAPRGRRLRRALRVGVPLAVGLILHALFTWRLYGSVSPASIYLGAGEQGGAPALGGDWGAYLAAWPEAAATAIGYLLDQKEGLLAYGPHYLLAVAGLAWLSRRRRKLLLSLGLVAAAYVGPYALSQQLGGQGPPVRPLMAVLWTLAPALGVALAAAGPGRAYAVLRGGALALAGSLMLAYASQPELLPHDYPVRASRLLQNYAPYGSGWWRLFPQWVNVDDPNRVVTALWTAAVVVLAAALWRHGRRVADRSAEAAPRSSAAAWRTAGHAAMVVIVAVGAYVLVHHVAVTRTDRHRPTRMASGLTAWIPEQLPAVAFAEEGGVWATPGSPVDFVITAPASLQSIDIALRVLVPTEVAVVVQGAASSGRAAPGMQHVARLRPSPGRSDGGAYAYHVRLRADAGAAPADLQGGEDERQLGVLLQVVGGVQGNIGSR